MRTLILAAMLVAALPALGDSHGSAELGPITETFSCTFNEGKGPEDLWAFGDALNQQVDRLGSDNWSGYFGAVLTPLRASMDQGDYGWIGYWPNLNAMASGLDDFYAHSGSAAVDALALEVASCKANTWLRTPLLSNFPEEDATPQSDAVELYWCTLRDGATLADVEAAEAKFVAANGDAPIAVDRWTPFLANTPSDMVYLVAHEDLGSFASYQTAWQNSDAGQANSAAFEAIANCESGLFTGRVIREPASD